MFCVLVPSWSRELSGLVSLIANVFWGGVLLVVVPSLFVVSSQLPGGKLPFQGFSVAVNPGCFFF